MRKVMFEEHKGYGGMYFVFTNVICALITVIVLRLSWTSQVVAMSDNLAYIVSINTSVNNYISNQKPYTKTNPSIPLTTGGSYNPLNDFNTMARSAGISTSDASTCTVTWDGKRTTIQIGGFNTIMNITVKPHRQESVIEKN